MRLKCQASVRDEDMLACWLNVLTDSINTVMAKGVASENGNARVIDCCSLQV